MKKSKVLFICVHNSARSQMAAAFLNSICPEEFEAHSAGFEFGNLNRFAVEAMSEIGIDISKKKTQTVFDVWKKGPAFSHVITVCSEAELKARSCPVFPGVTTRLHWPFADPSTFDGSDGAKLEQTRQVRDAIKARVEAWCEEICRHSANPSSVFP